MSYQSLENAIRIEAAKANGRVVDAYAKLTKAIAAPTRVPVGLFEDVSRAEATLAVWTKLNIIADRYANSDALTISKRLVFAVRKLRDELVEEYEVVSTNNWINAESGTNRRAKVEVYAVLREFVED